MDNIESWSTNEITINWNAPLAWVSAYLDEQGPKAGEGGTIDPVYGDVNADGRIDSLDLVIFKKYLLSQDISVINADNSDINKDDRIDAIDFVQLKALLMK